MLSRLREWYEGFAVVLLNGCLLFVLLNGVAAYFQRRSAPPVLGPIRSTIANAHPDLDVAALDALVAESDRPLAYEPYTDMTDPPVRGRFVNVDQAGFRRSTDQAAWPPDPKNYNLFVFGGSTTFGYGVGDDHTIASYLQPLLAPVGGKPVRVYNFGHSGYYSTQERILFTRLVVQGHAPDAAIFIDGLNDSGAIDDVPMIAGRLVNGYRFFSESSLQLALSALPLATTARHVGRSLGLGPPDVGGDPPLTSEAKPDDPDALRTILDRYHRSMVTIAAVGAAHGVRTTFFWQPVPTYRFPPGDAGRWFVGGALVWAHNTYPLMRQMTDAGTLGRDFHWCADLASDDGTDTFYVDRVHYAPVLAERVARCIAAAF